MHQTMVCAITTQVVMDKSSQLMTCHLFKRVVEKLFTLWHQEIAHHRYGQIQPTARLLQRISED